MINNYKSTHFTNTPQVAGVMPNDCNVEFVGIRKTKEVIWLQNGQSRYFTDLPFHFYELLRNSYLKDHKAVEFLQGVSEDLRRQVELYTYYIYGELDNTPDIVNGELAPSENFRDSQNCPSLLWNSKKITINDHELTPRQLIIIDLIGSDMPDKAIADALGISLKTLDFHKANLFRSVGVSTKTALLKLSLQQHIIA
ncbi:response regulator transcription factor [Arenibacter sp. 6A1]|uniref:helix-turn-helix transcriptional regulator n=1 Tax=Arenibacter sp. 6A1 TaxID=2720391 RepID=UPI0014457728|nr:LuxR C-terminal-related transcriptional regulator [Arenibacter sp. 6A1]NKI28237.1 response regulator transcription factor [Arenibacter sp. 6A1]